jgi:hypothetical protein
MTTNHTDAAAATREVLADLERSLAEIEAAIPTAKGYILAWDTGLGVHFASANYNGPCVVSLLGATPIVPRRPRPTVRNGHGIEARLTPLADALRAEAVSLRKLIADFAQRDA